MGLGALGLLAFPLAGGFLAHNLTLRFGSNAGSLALRLFTDRHALWAVGAGAPVVLRALHLAHWLLALDIADGVRRSRAGVMADGLRANGLTDRRAGWIIALPAALWVALDVLPPAEGDRGCQHKHK